jgi:hypothetical protein
MQMVLNKIIKLAVYAAIKNDELHLRGSAGFSKKSHAKQIPNRAEGSNSKSAILFFFFWLKK